QEQLAPEICGSKPWAFLAAKAYGAYGARRDDPGAPQRSQYGEASDHAGKPVEITAARHRIEVGCNDHLGFVVSSAVRRQGEIADTVERGIEAFALGEGHQDLGGARLILSEGIARNADSVTRCLADLLEEMLDLGGEGLDCRGQLLMHCTPRDE